MLINTLIKNQPIYINSKFEITPFLCIHNTTACLNVLYIKIWCILCLRLHSS